MGDGIHGTPEYSEGGSVYFINGNNLFDGQILIKPDTKTVSKEEAVKHSRLLNESTVLVSINGTIGNIAFYSGENVILGKSACYFNLLNGIERKYIKIVLQTDYFLEYTKRVATGSTIKNVPLSGMRNVLIPIPPKDEQQVIIDKLSSLKLLIEKFNIEQSQLNKLNAELRSVLKKSILQEAIQGKLLPQITEEGTAQELLEQIRQEKQRLVKEGKLKKSALLDSIIYKGDDNKYYEQIGSEVTDITDDIPFEIPINWTWVRLKDLCTINTGVTFKKEEISSDNKGIRVLRGGNIQRFQLCIKPDDLFIPEEKVKKSILLKQNDIVTPAVTSLENIGKMARIEMDMCNTTVGGFVFIIRPFGASVYFSKYLLTFMSSPTAIEYMKSITNKSGQAFYNIGKERLMNALVPVPPLAEQGRIDRQITDVFSRIKA